MKKVLLILSIVFTILTFIGIGFVLMNKGNVNAGYAIVPMILTLVSVSSYRWC